MFYNRQKMFRDLWSNKLRLNLKKRIFISSLLFFLDIKGRNFSSAIYSRNALEKESKWYFFLSICCIFQRHILIETFFCMNFSTLVEYFFIQSIKSQFWVNFLKGCDIEGWGSFIFRSINSISLYFATSKNNKLK